MDGGLGSHLYFFILEHIKKEVLLNGYDKL